MCLIVDAIPHLRVIDGCTQTLGSVVLALQECFVRLNHLTEQYQAA